MEPQCDCCTDFKATRMCFSCDPSGSAPVYMCGSCSERAHFGPMRLSHHIKSLINIRLREELLSKHNHWSTKQKEDINLCIGQLQGYVNDLENQKATDLGIMNSTFEPLKNAVINRKRELTAQIVAHYETLRSPLTETVTKCLGHISAVNKMVEFDPSSIKHMLPVLKDGHRVIFPPDWDPKLVLDNILQCQLKSMPTEITDELVTNLTLACGDVVEVYSNPMNKDGIFWLKLCVPGELTSPLYQIAFKCREKVLLRQVERYSEHPQDLHTGMVVMLHHPEDGVWYRAIVLDPCVKDQVSKEGDCVASVVVADTGYKLEVQHQRLATCSPDDLKMPFLAAACSLYPGEHPQLGNGPKWLFNDLIKADKGKPRLFKAKFVHKKAAHITVPLWYVELVDAKDGSISVNQLIEENCASSLTVQGPMVSKDIRVATGEIKSSKMEICGKTPNDNVGDCEASAVKPLVPSQPHSKKSPSCFDHDSDELSSTAVGAVTAAQLVDSSSSAAVTAAQLVDSSSTTAAQLVDSSPKSLPSAQHSESQTDSTTEWPPGLAKPNLSQPPPELNSSSSGSINVSSQLGDLDLNSETVCSVTSEGGEWAQPECSPTASLPTPASAAINTQVTGGEVRGQLDEDVATHTFLPDCTFDLMDFTEPEDIRSITVVSPTVSQSVATERGDISDTTVTSSTLCVENASSIDPEQASPTSSDPSGSDLQSSTSRKSSKKKKNKNKSKQTVVKKNGYVEYNESPPLKVPDVDSPHNGGAGEGVPADDSVKAKSVTIVGQSAIRTWIGSPSRPVGGLPAIGFVSPRLADDEVKVTNDISITKNKTLNLADSSKSASPDSTTSLADAEHNENVKECGDGKSAVSSQLVPQSESNQGTDQVQYDEDAWQENSSPIQAPERPPTVYTTSGRYQKTGHGAHQCGNYKYVCYLCGDPSHVKRDCPTIKRDCPTICSLCSGHGHRTNNCPKARNAFNKGGCPYCFNLTHNLSEAPTHCNPPEKIKFCFLYPTGRSNKNRGRRNY